MAATAYDEAALQLRGQGMQLNFPELKGFVASHIDESHWTHQSWWVLLPGKVEDSGELNVFPSETRPGNSFTHMMVGNEGNPDRICSTRFFLKKKGSSNGRNGIEFNSAYKHAQRCATTHVSLTAMALQFCCNPSSVVWR